MEESSELQQFLESSSEVGQAESVGVFTISREAALQKLAAFQLPFSEAWTVKVVQAAVAAQTTSPIRVDVTRNEARFFFRPGRAFTLDGIEEAFYKPEPGSDRALNHLVNALWSVGIADKRSFCLALPQSSTKLVWDGRELSRVEAENRRDCCFLEVSHGSQLEEKPSWFKRMIGKSSVSAEIFQTMARHCFTCPVPLTVDAMRVDSLKLCPDRGWNRGSLPLDLSFSDSELPSFPVAPGTFEDLPAHTSREWSYVGFEKMGADLVEPREAFERTSLACLLSGHFTSLRSLKDEWRFSLGYSNIYWVADGVVVDEEYLDGSPRVCSVAVFLSAEELPTDLTGLRLLSSPLREERRRSARRGACQILESQESLKRKLVGAKVRWFVDSVNTTTKRLNIGEIKEEAVQSLITFGDQAYWSLSGTRAEGGFLDELQRQVNDLLQQLQEGIEQA